MSEQPTAGALVARGPRPQHPSRRALMWCAVYCCLLGLALLVLDLAWWGVSGHYESPSQWGLIALRWLALPGIALAGGAAMMAGSGSRPRPWSFLIALLMLLVYAWCWDMAEFLTTAPPTIGD